MLPLRMNCSVLRVLVPALTLLMPAVADKGQTADTRSELAKLLSQLEWARLQGDEERVEAAYQRLESTNRWPDDLREDVLSRHAVVLLDLQRPEEAAVLAQAVMASTMGRTGRSSPETAFAQTLMAKVFIQQGLPKEAGRLLREARTTVRSTLGPKHLDTARIETTYAAVLAASGKLHEAEQILMEIEDRMTQTLTHEGVELALVRFNLGFLYFHEHKLALAEAELQSACRSWQKILGENSPYYVRALNHLVQVQVQLGELRQA